MKVEEIFFLDPEADSPVRVFLESASAGSGNFVATEQGSQYISMVAQFTRNPKETYLAQVSGDSMIMAGISDGDTLIVDYGIEAQEGDIVIAVYCGEIHVKVAHFEGSRAFLCAANPKYRDIEIADPSRFEILGVVLHCIKPLYSGRQYQPRKNFSLEQN